MFFLMPTTAAVVAVVKKNRREVIRFSDLRVRVMNELLTGIRIVKFYAWERPFGRQVANLRDQELKALTKLAYVSALGFSFLVISAPIIQPILVFATFVKIEDQPLSASMAFTTVALFNIMRFPFVFMPIALVQYVQSVIALKRVVRYLCLPELTEYVQDGPPPSSEASNPDSPMAQPGSITIANGTFSWSDPNVAEPVQTVVGGAKDPATKNAGAEMSSEKEELKNTIPTLQNLNCQIGAGSLIAVVGPVGSGKSSFLSALLGEMEALEDSKVYMPDYNTHSLSYCAQTPWVINDTIQGNILFGRSFDAERYYQVLEDCALLDDLKILPAGDKTEIGERGINLSGGQKARVSLARALYSLDTKIVLMDDPLSAVDSQVSEHLFSRAILPSETTRILVTHHVHVLPQCDHILVFDKGQIQAQGTYDELIAMGVDFKDAVQTARTTPNTEKEEVKEEIKSPTQLDATKQVVAEREHDAKTGATLVEDEEREEGRVEGAAYIHYIKAGGVCTALCILLIQGIGRGLEITGSFWLAAWTDETATNDLTEADTTFYVGIYAVFGMIGIFAVAIRGVLMAQHRLRASRTLHQDLTQSILKAPVAFFDVTPLGRILNRFAADMDKVDIELTQFLTRGIDALFNVLGSICAIIAATKGTFLIPLVPLGIMYYWVQLWFRKTSTELQRITKIATSPIFADFSQTLSGTSTIRAYSAQSKFFDKSVKNYDKLNSSYLLVQLVGYWLALRLDIMGGLISAFIGAVAIATHFIPAGWLGLSLTYSIEITTYLKFVVQMVANIEGEMSSVERILNYSHQIEQESTTESAEVTDTASWPSDGALRFRNASMRYRNGPPVLRNLSFEIKPGEKIGICGRTGSGKSSLMVALFRICELAEGYIQLDEVDISKVDLETLRSNLSIIPQGPVLFSNTVKFNLDPTLTHDDETLWEALRKVGMEKTVSEMRGLEALVSEGGENFSQGQRQLICIARALMRNAQILVMDEATASIDNETDAMVQEMIAKHFAHCTILTIAHRLNTIMESDRILVLDDGEIVEFDTPRNLLQDANGQFFKLVEMSEQATNKE
jgi:ABC-type multidrug transport system fused ATPase/permease subunit